MKADDYLDLMRQSMVEWHSDCCPLYNRKHI